MKRFTDIFVLILSFSSLTCSQGRAEQRTTGYCSPAIDNTHGNVTTNCYVSLAAYRKSVDEKLAEAEDSLNQLSETQQYYLLVTMGEYIDSPTPENWKAAKRDADAVSRQLIDAVEAAISFDASLDIDSRPRLRKIHETLRMRGKLISQLPDAPPSKDFIERWRSQYEKEVSALLGEITALRGSFVKASYKPENK